MKKKKYSTTVAIGLLLGFFITSIDENILIVINQPISLFIDIITGLSLSSFVGNIIAWILILFIAFLPLLLINKYKKDKRLNLLYLIIGIVILVSIIFYFQPYNIMSVPLIMHKIVIGFILGSVILGLMYELWFVKSNKPKTILKMVILCITLITSLTIAVLIMTLNTDNLLITISTISELIVKVILLYLLYLIYNYLYLEHTNIFSDLSLRQLKNIEKCANILLAYSIYISIFLNFSKLFITNHDVNFSFNFPIKEVIIASVISLFINFMVSAISVKKENDQFI